MKIGSRIHPRAADFRRVTIHGREYIFAKTEDKFGDKHFVAEVTKEEHAAVLLGTDDFYIYKADMAPEPAIKAPAPAPADPPKADGAVLPPDVQAEAEKLLGGSAASISSAVGSVSSPAVVTAALAIEQAKASPRVTVMKLLEATLEGIKAAGLAP